MSFNEAIDLLGRDEAFRATVYAMNTLLIQKGVYSAKEFEALFCEHAENFKNGFRGEPGIAGQTARETFASNS
jgi:hypothetical protein